MNANTLTVDDLLQRLDDLNAIGIALSKERDTTRLLETILLAAKSITNADGGTLYLMQEELGERSLKFEIMRTDSLHIAMGGTTGVPIPFYPIHLIGQDGKPNHFMVAVYAVLHDKTVNIADAYTAEGFDFSGTKNFDKKTGYRSQSFLTVPMKNHENEIIGVLQLINAQDKQTNTIIPFSAADQHMVESLASQAAIALTNRQLINQLENLFESLIKLINTAIDHKSPYTGGHCERVPTLSLMLADAVNRTTVGPLKYFQMSETDRYELKIAALLHDCGKISTPVHVVDKATKLQTIFDRIDMIDARFEVLKRDAEIELLKARLESGSDSRAIAELEQQFQERIRKIDEDREYLRRCNLGGEFMAPELQERVKQIGSGYTWQNSEGKQVPFLSEDEIYNLNIKAGTLTAEEREIINDHVVLTIKMLEELPWPKHLRNVSEYAGGHHERMDGKGYPRGLMREQMSVQARVMGIADIFEALTAADRPYKKGKTLTESLNILGKMKLGNHIDADLFDVFVREKIYLDYARQFLDPAQIDEVDESKIPGFTPGDA
ncbi:MAG: HD domain-containing phosphohydrolase [Pseudomonadota bacterium]